MALSQERKGTIAVSLTNFLDSGCIVASSVALAAWAVAFNFGSAWTAILGAVGANAFGAAVGALIGGFLTDKLGRKFIYTYNMLVYATGVFIVMIAANLPMLVIGIVISGLSVGAGVPASWSYISEMSGSNRRASNIGISQFAWSCGPAVIFLISLIFSLVFPTFAASGELLPAGTYGPFDGLFAMRLLFAILFVVALVAWNLQRKLQESTDWTSKQELKAKESFVSMMKRALTNAVNIKTIIFLVAVYLTWNIVAGTMGQFMPYMYAAAGNLDDTTISLLQTVMWVLTAIGSLAIFSALGDKVPHRILFALTAGWRWRRGWSWCSSARSSKRARPIAGVGCSGYSLPFGAFQQAFQLSASTRSGRPSSSLPSIVVACKASCSSSCVACSASGHSLLLPALALKRLQAS